MLSKWFPTVSALFAKRRGSPRWMWSIRLAGRASTWRMSTWWLPDSMASSQVSLMRMLAIAQRENLPLAPLVSHLADEHRGRNRRRLLRFAKRLNSLPLIDALEQTPGVLANSDILTLRLANQSGTLGESYPALLQMDHEVQQELKSDFSKSCWYFGFVALIFAVVITFLNTKIQPTFDQLITEMDDPASDGVRTFALRVLWSHSLTQALVAIVVGGLLLYGFFQFTRWGRSLKSTLASRLLSPVFSLRSAHLLWMLAISKDAGRPLPNSLSTLARYHFDKNFRQNLLFARNEVEQGATVWESLAKSRIISAAEASALQSTEGNEATSWLLRKLAQQKRSKVLVMSAFCISLFHPLLVLLFGIIVLWVSSSYIGSLRDLVLYMA